MQISAEANSVFQTSICTGCKTCEIACSYHHQKVFNTSMSSIEIVPREEDLAFDIRLYRESTGKHLGCDGCTNEKEPLCVKYCPLIAKAELRHVIQEFRREVA